MTTPPSATRSLLPSPRYTSLRASSLLPVVATMVCPHRHRGGSPFPLEPCLDYPDCAGVVCPFPGLAAAHAILDDASGYIASKPSTAAGILEVMRRPEDRFSGLMGAAFDPPTIGSSKTIVRRVHTQTFLSFVMAISLLQPTTLLALPTTTPTRATTEASHRADEASHFQFHLLFLPPCNGLGGFYIIGNHLCQVFNKFSDRTLYGLYIFKDIIVNHLWIGLRVKFVSYGVLMHKSVLHLQFYTIIVLHDIAVHSDYFQWIMYEALQCKIVPRQLNPLDRYSKSLCTYRVYDYSATKYWPIPIIT
uniref:Uncharacterized protein n=1 Tax=Oryza nivara TaxID=4536 RepID=A0A0E0FM57_ORYNI